MDVKGLENASFGSILIPVCERRVGIKMCTAVVQSPEMLLTECHARKSINASKATSSRNKRRVVICLFLLLALLGVHLSVYGFANKNSSSKRMSELCSASCTLQNKFLRHFIFQHTKMLSTADFY